MEEILKEVLFKVKNMNTIVDEIEQIEKELTIILGSHNARKEIILSALLNVTVPYLALIEEEDRSELYKEIETRVLKEEKKNDRSTK